MSEPESPASAEPEPPAQPLDAVRGLLGRATQHLLGATIELDDPQWREPSKLPDWSRGHVASHLARNAEGIGRLAGWALTGEPQQMYSSREQRAADIEAGAGRAGLELQVDLDTSAGELEGLFVQLDEAGHWDARVEVREVEQPARLLPLLRLSEVVLHHVDLDVGYRIDDIDDETSTWLLELVALRLADRTDFPRVEVRTDQGFHAVVGGDGEPVQISGRGQHVLGWLTGRTGVEDLQGAEGVQLPAFA